MKCTAAAISLTLLVSCAGRVPSQSLGGLGLVKVYTVEDHEDTTCETLIKTFKADGEIHGSLQSQSLADFEIDGFATVHIPHVPSSKKYLVFVSVTDPDSGAPIGHGCVENLEVRKGAIRDVPIILQSPTPREGE